MNKIRKEREAGRKAKAEEKRARKRPATTKLKAAAR